MWDNGFGDAAPAPDPSASPLPNTAPTPTPPLVPITGSAQLPAPAPAATAQRRAGAAVLLVGAGVTTGALFGGAWGAGSGLFFAGALSNLYRASSLWRSDFADDRAEAVKTTVMAVLGTGLGVYLGYRAHEARKDD
jgi:hypothetical protein